MAAKTKRSSKYNKNNLLAKKSKNISIGQIDQIDQNDQNDQNGQINEIDQIDEKAITDKTTINNKNKLENFNIPKQIINNLKRQSINQLFEIQAQSFDTILSGNDFIGRARTGQGKTLAFVLPIVTKLFNDSAKTNQKTRLKLNSPKVLVLCPTRELAKQVATVFEQTCKNMLNVCTVYGGVPYGKQQAMLRRGSEVVVGTCGRVKDLLEKKMLILDSLNFVVLDEVDEMLNIGFADDVETILSQVSVAKQKHQVLLFSATLPKWVKGITKKYLSEDHKQIDLVGKESAVQTSRTIKHIAICCHASARNAVLSSFLQGTLNNGDRAIVFAERKKDCNELAQFLTSCDAAKHCRVLHGDIPQTERTATLKAFREKRFSVLVATDVAARGISIEGLRLVVQISAPKNPETYVHRSGRTGRAGADGTCVLLYTPKDSFSVRNIELKAKIEFERCGAPSPAKLMERAIEKIQNFTEKIPKETKKLLKPLLKNINLESLSSKDCLMAALLMTSGNSNNFEKRSLLCGADDLITFTIQLNNRSDRQTIVKKCREKIGFNNGYVALKNLTLFKDRTGAAFDIEKRHESALKRLIDEKNKNSSEAVVEEAESLPPLASFSLNSGERRGYNSRGSGSGSGFGNRNGFARNSFRKRSNSFLGNSRGGYRSKRFK